MRSDGGITTPPRTVLRSLAANKIPSGGNVFERLTPVTVCTDILRGSTLY